MPLETATYVDALVTSNPDGTDQRSTADDHLRLIKAALKRTFPMMGGAVSASAQAVTYVNDLSAGAQAQLNTLRDGSATANNAVNARYANSASTAAYIGTIPAAQVPDLKAANAFSAAQTVAFAGAYIVLRDTAGATDLQKAYVQASTVGGAQRLRLGMLNDAETLAYPLFDASRLSVDAVPVVVFTARPAVNGTNVLIESDAVDADYLGGVAAAAFARLDTAQSFAKGQAITQVNSTGTSLTPDCDASTMFRHILTGATTVNDPINARSGMVITLHLIQDGTGSRTVSWSSVFKFAGGTAPTLSTAASYVDVLAFQYDATSGVWRQAGLGMVG